jgi:hypothetical protein
MRLRVVEHGHSIGQKIMFGITRLMSGFRASDVRRTLKYRKEFFGDPQCGLTEQVMRGPSGWSVFERELFAAYVSRLNQCLF